MTFLTALINATLGFLLMTLMSLPHHLLFEILKKLINEELVKMQEWCDLNKLCINIKKTIYMIVKSPKRKSGNINIKLPNKDGNSDVIEKRDHIKYLGVLCDE